MGPGTTNTCVEADPCACLRLSQELFLLHTMSLGWNTLIGKNMLDIDKSGSEMKHFIFHLFKDVLPTIEGI